MVSHASTFPRTTRTHTKTPWSPTVTALLGWTNDIIYFLTGHYILYSNSDANKQSSKAAKMYRNGKHWEIHTHAPQISAPFTTRKFPARNKIKQCWSAERKESDTPRRRKSWESWVPQRIDTNSFGSYFQFDLTTISCLLHLYTHNLFSSILSLSRIFRLHLLPTNFISSIMWMEAPFTHNHIQIHRQYKAAAELTNVSHSEFTWSYRTWNNKQKKRNERLQTLTAKEYLSVSVTQRGGKQS